MENIEYPAMVYKNRKNNAYIANCLMFNLTGYGKTEEDALSNLETSMNEILEDCNIVIKPLRKMALC